MSPRLNGLQGAQRPEAGRWTRSLEIDSWVT